MGKPEGAVEDHLKAQCERYGVLCYKFVSPSTTGVPDRVLIGHKKTVFVELKAPGEKPRPRQKLIIRDMKDHGAAVYVVDTKTGIDNLMKKLFPAPPRAASGSKKTEPKCIGSLLDM